MSCSFIFVVSVVLAVSPARFPLISIGGLPGWVLRCGEVLWFVTFEVCFVLFELCGLLGFKVFVLVLSSVVCWASNNDMFWLYALWFVEH